VVKGWSLIAKFLALYISLLSLSAVVLFAALEYRYYQEERKSLIDSVQVTAQVQQSALANAIHIGDDRRVRHLVEEMGRLDYIHVVSVYDANDNLISDGAS
jgi:hypothetical protein